VLEATGNSLSYVLLVIVMFLWDEMEHELFHMLPLLVALVWLLSPHNSLKVGACWIHLDLAIHLSLYLLS
jgi:hypothetical protein